jgi:hypothetical protein
MKILNSGGDVRQHMSSPEEGTIKTPSQKTPDIKRYSKFLFSFLYYFQSLININDSSDSSC